MNGPVIKICTICARGGSRELPGKNLRPLAGKPLIVWSIEQAIASRIFDLVAVSSDCPDIQRIARGAGAGLVVERPPQMATDDAPKLPSVKHAVLASESHIGEQADIIVDLQPTSPLRDIADIAAAIALLARTQSDSIVTGAKAKCSPYFSLLELAADGTVHISKQVEAPIGRRQDAPMCYDMNGSIYVWKRQPFIEDPQVFYASTRLYEMPLERSIDIDSETDFAIANYLMERKLVQTSG